MKKFKKLIPAVVMLLIATMLMGTTTYAWFSMNKTVTASGMLVKAQAEGSIIITAGTLPASGTKATDYTFSEAATTLYASTHSTDYTNHEKGLKAVSNAENINIETGLRKNNVSGTELTYIAAVNGDKTYYKDFTVFIAGDGQAFASQTITISLAGTFETVANTINNAVSVDFYGESVSSTSVTASSSTYKGTLNVAGKKNNSEGNGNSAYTSFTITGVTIPQANGSAAYGVLMRVYYDGALIETGGTNAYTTYKTTTDTTAVADTIYYSDVNGSRIETVTVGTTDVTGKYVVDSAKSTYAYARTTEVNKLQNVTLVATFAASDTP